MNLNWESGATREFVEAAGYFGNIDPDLGDRFISAVEVAIARLKAAPQLFRRFDGAARKVRVERFPYAVVYWLDGDVIHIIAVLHLHREPGYWRERI